jgi:DNA repair protein RadC
MGAKAADPLRLALRTGASGFVLVHNHPSGDPVPSKEDVAFTRRVAEAAVVVGIPLLDHVVVARGGFASVPFPGSSGEGA